MRKKLGIDRPGAIAFAKALLDKNPVLEAKKVIEEVGTALRHPPRRCRTSRACAPWAPRRRRGGPRADRARCAARRRAAGGRRGSISVTYQGSGHPEDLAAFFRSLAED